VTGGRLEVVSGGQTGVDRAALDTALDLGLDCGGWCPRGRRAEDGPLGARYPVRETPSDGYPQRTEWNVRDSDATLILHRGRLRGGTALTMRLARRLGRPTFAVDLSTATPAGAVREWLARERVRRVNIAGPRESEQPGIHAQAAAFLRDVLAPRDDGDTE
jgi:hypothetical protein